MAGVPWELWEDAVVADIYPDIPAIRHVLPHRTHGAIKSRARSLNAQSFSQRPWRQTQIREIDAMWREGRSLKEIQRHFPGRSRHAINFQLNKLGHYLGHVRKQSVVPAMGDVTGRCTEANVPLCDLARAVGLKALPTEHNLRRAGLSPVLLQKMAHLLGGEIDIEWRD